MTDKPLVPISQEKYLSILGLGTLARQHWKADEQCYEYIKRNFPGLEDYFMDAYMSDSNIDEELRKKMEYAGYKINDKKDVNGVI